MHFTVAESPKCLFISPTLLHDIAQNSEKAENFILIKQENWSFWPHVCKKEIWMQEITSKWNEKKKVYRVKKIKKEKSIQEAILGKHHHQKGIVCKMSRICKIQSCSVKQRKPLHVLIVSSWGQGGSPAVQGWHLVMATSICSQLQPS